MITIENLSFTYPDGTEALKSIHAVFPPEHIYAVMGLSGSGKTTLLNCMARFLAPQHGTITIDGANIDGIPEREFRQRLGVVFQRFNLFPHLTVLENMILAPHRVQKRGKKEAVDAARDMLERLGIPELGESYPSQVSGGQAQRVAIARGLMLRPQVMLLDEPTSALDAHTTAEFAHWLRELQSETSFIAVTHDLSFARQVAENGLYMSAGKILKSGRIADILAELETGNI